MDRKFIFCVVIGFVCLYQPTTSIIQNKVSEFERQVDESMAGAFKEIKLIETKLLPQISNPYHFINDFHVQIVKVIVNRAQELVAELKSFYIDLKAQSIKSGVLPDMDKNVFDSKMLELTPKYMDLLYTDVVDIILNESRLYEDEKLTIINEMLSLLEIIKTDIIPKLKKEIDDHPQDWTRAGLLLGLIGTRISSHEVPFNVSEMDAIWRIYDIMNPYEISLKTHTARLDTAFTSFFKRVEQQKKNPLLMTESQIQ